MKPKRRMISFLLAICLVVGLMPTAAFAAGTDTGKAIQLGTSGISDPTSTKDISGTYYTPSDYVYFGVNGSDPIKWRVLDADKTNDGTTSGMFLLSEYLLDSGVVFESAWNSDDNDGQGSQYNAWQHSDAQNWCSTFATNTAFFSTAEQAAFLGVAKTDTAEDDLYSLSWGTSSLTENDNVFFLSVRELADYVGNYNGAPGLIATDTAQSAGVWWLRSPHADYTDLAGAVSLDGLVYYDNVDTDWAARPAFNVNLDSVLFTSAAAGGKIPAANGGGNQGGEAADAIFEIPTTTTSEWKLTLLDSSRNFSVTETAAIGKSGDTITLNYTGATTGTNEYISVIIADNEGAKYYGRITQPTSESGTVDVKIPANLAEGSYTLSVFSEQYNGGENDDTKLTDYASAFETVALTVDNAPTLTAGTVSRTSDTEATVKFTSSEAGTYYSSEVLDSGANAPTIETTGTGTTCDTSEQTISLTTLTAGAKDIYIVVKDAAGNVSSALKIEIPAYVAPVYSISADTTTLNFGSVQTGYTAPEARTITVTNTGNQQITLIQPTASNYTIGALSKAELAAGETATFTVQPKSGLAVGTYNETITVKDASGGNSTNEISISANFTVQSGGSNPDPDPHSHSGGTATCQSPATCSGCGQTYGSKNNNNHTGGTEIRGYVAPTATKAGYTGDTYCKGCGAKIGTGSTIPKTGGGSNRPSYDDDSGNENTPTVITVPISGTENTIHEEVTIDGKKATITDVDFSDLHTVIGDHVETGVITIDFSVLDIELDTVEIPADVVKEIAKAANDPDNDAESLEIVFTDGTSIEFDAKALGEKSRQAGGFDITISIKHTEDSSLNRSQREAVGDRIAYHINVTSGGKHISDMGGKVSVHAPYELRPGEKGNGLIVYYVDDNGNKEACETSYDSVRKRVNWKTDYLSVYMIGYDEGNVNPDTGAGNPFTDVSETDWFFEDVMFVYDNGLMVGTSDTTFSPYGDTSRAMVATVLWRMEGSPAQEGDDPFTDTESGAWYSDGITWAAEAGIAEGYGGGLFGPNDPVTREQLAAFFYRYAEYRGYDLSPTDDLSGFTDADSVSDWAQEAMKWAIGSGLIAGRDDKRIDPQATATRAEFAAMLHRFIEKYGLEEKTTYTGLMGWVDPNSDYMKSPKTGDGAAATAGWISLFAAGTAGAGYAAYKLRRRKKDNLKPPTPTPA